jgi:hypothetical protein
LVKVAELSVCVKAGVQGQILVVFMGLELTNFGLGIRGVEECWRAEIASLKVIARKKGGKPKG